MSSKRAIRRRSCEGKIRYGTEDAAWKVIRRTYRGLRPYKCQFCGAFHIGHVPGKQKRRRVVHG